MISYSGKLSFHTLYFGTSGAHWHSTSSPQSLLERHTPFLFSDAVLLQGRLTSPQKGNASALPVIWGPAFTTLHSWSLQRQLAAGSSHLAALLKVLQR